MTRIGRLKTCIGRVAAMGAAIVLHATPANAESVASDRALPSNEASAGVSGVARNATTRANVFFVGVNEDCTGLAQTIGDLLVAHNILTHFEYR